MYRIAPFIAAFVIMLPGLVRAAPAPITDYIPARDDALRMGIALAPAAVTGITDDTQLFEMAEALWAWQMLGDRAAIKGDDEQYRASSLKSNLLYYELIRRHPKRSDLYWRVARNLYDAGEMTPTDDKEARKKLYEEMVAITKKCIDDVDPKDAGCVFYYGVGMGRQATQRGVLASLFAVDDIEGALMSSEKLEANYPLPAWDEPLLADIYYAASVAYRVLPDNWLIKLITGVRGDKGKALQYIRKAVAIQPYRLELEKELAVALICYGDDEDKPELITEAKVLIKKMNEGAFDRYDVRSTDTIDKRHASELIAHRDQACGYSRDGYQNVSEEAIKNAKK